MTELQQPTNNFRVAVAGRPLPEDVAKAMVTAVVDTNVALPDAFALTFRDPARSVLGDAGFAMGAKVTITVTSEADTAGPLLTGEVTALEAEHDPGGTYTVVRGYDQSHRLLRGRRTETYVDVTYADVAKRVAQLAGLTPGVIESTPTSYPHVAQGNQSDWEFLWALAREVGYEVAVADGKLHFRTASPAASGPGTGSLTSQNPLQLSLGSNLLRFRAVVTAAEQVGQVQVRGWDVAQKRPLVGVAPAATGSAELSVTPKQVAGTFGAPPYVSVGVPYGTQAEVDAAAQAVAEQIGGAFAEFDGVARGNPALKAGSAVSLALVGAPFDGKYVLTSARHVYDAATGYTTALAVSGRQQRSLLGLVNGSRAGRPGILPGAASAQVTDVHDPEDLGRVKLKFPWLSDDYVSDWVRVVSDGAGASRGSIWLPEVNDEVLVVFEQGDLRRPYLVGGLHNGVDKPKLGSGLVDASSGAVKRRGFVSKKGHCLLFFDDEADSGVAMLTGDSQLRLSLNGGTSTVKVSSNGRVEIGAGADVVIKAGGNLTLEAAAKVTLSGAQVAITGSGPVEVHGTPIKLN
jgi:phage protein D/phage baseplate assembly protein gpV